MTTRAATPSEVGWSSDQTPGDFARWVSAAALVTAVHAALLGTYLFWRTPDEAIGDSTESISIELDPIDTTADAKLDLAPAPEAMIEQKATPPKPEKPIERPNIAPPPEPDVAAVDITPPPTKPPEKIEESKPPAPMTAAPAKGGAPHVERSWQTLLMRKLQQFKRYPSGAQARGEQGEALLAFSVDRDGRVLARKIVRSSGHADLDNEVLAMLDRAQPLPAFPPGMTAGELSLTVPIRFSLR